MHRPLVATLLASVLALAGCVHVHEHDHHYESRGGYGGPPPHAPAHGYRHHHHDLDLRYDVMLGVYVVVGYPHVYFHDGLYFRRVGSNWESCRSWKKANWRTVEVEVVPVKLAKHYKGKGPKHGMSQGKGHGPAKHDD